MVEAKHSPVRSVQIFGNTVHAGIEKGSDAGIIREMLKDKVSSIKVKEIRPSLEDAFIDLLEREAQI